MFHRRTRLTLLTLLGCLGLAALAGVASYLTAKSTAAKLFAGSEQRLEPPKLSVQFLDGDHSLPVWEATACEIGNVCCDLGGAHAFISLAGSLVSTRPLDLRVWLRRISH